MIADIYQANRNPFIDRPEWVIEIFGNPLRLTSSLQIGILQLRWPAGLRRAVLEENGDLVTWTRFIPSPAASENDNVVSVQVQAQRMFYRLAVR
ncbi:MAG: hypothetical protein ACR2OZ_19120 [Verrucomicrobiales bacterium]